MYQYQLTTTYRVGTSAIGVIQDIFHWRQSYSRRLIEILLLFKCFRNCCDNTEATTNEAQKVIYRYLYLYVRGTLTLTQP